VNRPGDLHWPGILAGTVPGQPSFLLDLGDSGQLFLSGKIQILGVDILPLLADVLKISSNLGFGHTQLNGDMTQRHAAGEKLLHFQAARFHRDFLRGAFRHGN
jgi:hypothetical protein